MRRSSLEEGSPPETVSTSCSRMSRTAAGQAAAASTAAQHKARRRARTMAARPHMARARERTPEPSVECAEGRAAELATLGEAVGAGRCRWAGRAAARARQRGSGARCRPCLTGRCFGGGRATLAANTRSGARATRAGKAGARSSGRRSRRPVVDGAWVLLRRGGAARGAGRGRICSGRERSPQHGRSRPTAGMRSRRRTRRVR